MGQITKNSDPVSAVDKIGIPGVGTTQEGINYGSKWQMGIAVDLVNTHFDYGTIIQYKITSDPFNNSQVVSRATQIGIDNTIIDSNTQPSNLIQYGDHLRLGPSTDVNNLGYQETIRILGANEDVTSNSWSNAVIYSLDRANKYQYQLGDDVTIFGTGLAAGWQIKDNNLATRGIFKGFSSLNNMGAYSLKYSGKIIAADDTTAPNFIELKIPLPKKPGLTLTYDGLPSVYHSDLGLGPWRDPSIGDDTWDMDIDHGAATGLFRFIDKANDGSENVIFAYSSNVDPTTLNSLSNVVTHAPIITGFKHPGGQYKDSAQSLLTMTNSLSTLINGGNSYQSIGVLTQELTRSQQDKFDASYSKLVPGTYYRLGLTWKGDIQPSDSNSVGSSLWAKFQWAPVYSGGTINHYARGMISTTPLLDDNKKSQATWQDSMVSGYVGEAMVDQLDTDQPLRVEIIQDAQTVKSFQDARIDRGTEILNFIDNIWLEHEGDIDGASGQGYVELDTFPELSTLSINRYMANNTVSLTLSNGSTLRLDPTNSNKRYKVIIEADFLRVKDSMFNQLKQLLAWQDRGYKLTLHPFLPNIPHCLIGYMDITNVKKNSWDLTRYSFRFRFTEI